MINCYEEPLQQHRLHRRQPRQQRFQRCFGCVGGRVRGLRGHHQGPLLREGTVDAGDGPAGRAQGFGDLHPRQGRQDVQDRDDDHRHPGPVQGRSAQEAGCPAGLHGAVPRGDGSTGRSVDQHGARKAPPGPAQGLEERSDPGKRGPRASARSHRQG